MIDLIYSQWKKIFQSEVFSVLYTNKKDVWILYMHAYMNPLSYTLPFFVFCLMVKIIFLEKFRAAVYLWKLLNKNQQHAEYGQ